MAPQHVLDLTDEAALLGSSAALGSLGEGADRDPNGVRGLLSALQLKPVGGPTAGAAKGNVLDLAVYQATGDRRLATIFGTAA